MNPIPKNAVERRLDYLNGLWVEFATHPAARVLRWVVDQDARRLTGVFLELHSQHPAGLPDYFLPLDVPFRDETSYAPDLLRAWQAWFSTQKDDLLDNSRDATWSPPPARPADSGATAVVRAADSFRRTYASEFRYLTVALVPAEIADAAGWERWVQILGNLDIPSEVRFLLIDAAEAPLLSAAAGDAKGIMTQTPRIRMSEVYRELQAEAGGSGSGVVFRKHFVNMLTAAGESDLPAAEAAGKSALTVATAENWPDLQAAAQMGLAGVVAAAGREGDALIGYRAAVGFADVIPSDHPAAGALRTQTRMAVGGVLFGAKDYVQAATEYEQAGSLAPDPLLRMECWRMAAACYELLASDARAWECGQHALVAGAEIPPEVREKSTLTFAAQGLVRICGKRGYADRKDELLAAVNRLLAPGWEARRS